MSSEKQSENLCRRKLMNEHHGLPFVSYLRLAILKWGGIHGLEGKGTEFALVKELVEGRKRFARIMLFRAP